MFLTQLLDGSRVEQYNIPVKINAELRKYQQDGVNWLAFLAKYQLHGILCDGKSRVNNFVSYSVLTDVVAVQIWVLVKHFSLFVF